MFFYFLVSLLVFFPYSCTQSRGLGANAKLMSHGPIHQHVIQHHVELYAVEQASERAVLCVNEAFEGTIYIGEIYTKIYGRGLRALKSLVV